MPTTIALGAKATIAAVAYTVIGLMRRAEISDEATGEWTEYLLYAPQKGFIWLVESSDGWERSVLDTWPFWYDAEPGVSATMAYVRLYDYNTAVVHYAAGAFNWKAAIGGSPSSGPSPAKLAAESSESELTWSRSVPVAPDELVAWFGGGIGRHRAAAQQAAASWSTARTATVRAAKWLTVLLVAINAIPAVFSPGRTIFVVLLAVVGLWLPAWLMDTGGNRAGDR